MDNSDTAVSELVNYPLVQPMAVNAVDRRH